MSNLPLKKPKVETRELLENTETETPVPIPIPVDWKDFNPEDSLDQNRKFVLDELLRMILTELSSQDLVRSARLVSKVWRDQATWILRNKRLESFGITFKFHPGKNIFILDQNRGQNENVQDQQLQDESETSEQREAGEFENSVSKLTDLLKSTSACSSSQQNSYFPTAHIRFFGGSLNCPQVLEFFTVYGENIRKLTIDVRHNPLILTLARGGALRRKIFQLTPHLKSLELMDSNRHDLWPGIDVDDDAMLNPDEGQVRGQGQFRILQQLSSLKFSNSIRNLKRIHTLLKHIEPVLIPPSSAPSSVCTIFIPSIQMFDYSHSELHSGPDLKLDLFKIKRPHTVVIPNELCLTSPALNPDDVNRLEKLAECRFRFKMILLLWRVGLNSPQLQLSPIELWKKGVALRKIMEGARKTVERVNISILFFLLLSKQPIFPGFFQKLNLLLVGFLLTSEMENQDQDQNQNQVNSILNRLDCFSRSQYRLNTELNPIPIPTLWKNLSEVMPSLRCLNLVLFDGDCESWLPFFDKDAGQNLTVKMLQIQNLHRREILAKISGPFPALDFLYIDVWIVPPPLSSSLVVDSVENLIRWLFLFPEKKEEADSNEQTFHPFLACKSLTDITLAFQRCKAHLDQEQSSSSSSAIGDLCSMSKVKGEKRLLFHSCDEWEEITSKATKLIHTDAPDSDSSSSESLRFPKIFYIKITCNQHKTE